MSQALDLNSIDAVLPQLSALPSNGTDGQAASLSQSERRDTPTIGIKIRSMVILAAQDLASSEDGLPVIQLEWVTDSIFVARGGDASRSSEIIRRVRKICEDTLPASFEDVVGLFVQESNQELGNIVDATNVKCIFTVGGRLHREKDCKLFLVTRDYQQSPSLYVSKSGYVFFSPTSRGKKFFTKDVQTKILQAGRDYDRASLSEIVKEFIAHSCAKKTIKGRVTMVTVDDRGFHMFECAEYDEAKGRYKQSMFDEFYPVGYRTCEA